MSAIDAISKADSTNALSSYEVSINGHFVPGIKRFEIDENMFYDTPIAYLEFEDNGVFYGYKAIDINMKLDFKIWINTKNDPETIKESYTIVSVAIQPSFSSTNVKYVIHAIKSPQMKYRVESYSNRTTAAQCCRDMMAFGGIGATVEKDSSYTSLWLNGSLTCAQMVAKAENHIYTDDEDAGISYIDHNGGRITTLKTLAKKPIQYNLVHLSNNSVSTPNVIFYETAKFNANGGYNDAMGSGKIDFYMYDRGYAVKLDNGLFPKPELNDLTSLMYDTFKQEKSVDSTPVYTSNYGNATVGDLTQSKDLGMFFEDLGAMYDYSEAISLRNKRRFFRNFIKVSYSMYRQCNEYLLSKRAFPQLGDRINIDFDTGEYKYDIYNSNYIVTRIQLVFVERGDTKVELTCVCDGVQNTSKETVDGEK
ncbi:MAG: hypothetical protein MJZ34_04860 [Paludibacteraceae bacterium]|nr:hypothetical protein [Paludibacteraceae bacterium]